MSLGPKGEQHARRVDGHPSTLASMEPGVAAARETKAATPV